MERFLGKYSPYFYAIVRIIAGLMFAMHGSQKLLGWPVAGPPHLTGLLQAAGVIELVCGLLITCGLFASYAAFVASGEMAVAYFKQHAPHGTFPIMNGGELAVLNCFLFLYIASQGSGKWSLEGIFKRR